jgi:hypothetical protein
MSMRNSRIFQGISLAMIIASVACPANAKGPLSAVDDLMRGAGKVGPEVAIKGADDLVAGLAKNKAAREAVEAELKSVRTAGQQLSKSAEIAKYLAKTCPDVNPAIIRQIEQLGEEAQAASVMLSKGSRELATTVPDLAARGRIMANGGAETIAAVGLHGPDAAKAVLKLDEAIKGGVIISKDGARAVTLADFGKAMTKFGDGSWYFWKNAIEPHWGKWAASGALAMYLANPEYFQDQAGRLTEAGFEHLTKIIGVVVAESIRGVAKGTGGATEKIARSIWESFFDPAQFHFRIVGTLAFFACCSLFFRRIRYWFFSPFRWLNQIPDESGKGIT